jgi:hypothetical protein
MAQTSPPKLDAVRRNARVGPTLLPAGGRSGPIPTWPLSAPNAAEKLAWEQLWRTPHAVAWERLEWVRTVARYCRVMVLAEKRGAAAAVLAQTAVLEDRLGLTPKAMRMLMWDIVADEVAQKREETSSARGRIKAVG